MLFLLLYNNTASLPSYTFYQWLSLHLLLQFSSSFLYLPSPSPSLVSYIFFQPLLFLLLPFHPLSTKLKSLISLTSSCRLSIFHRSKLWPARRQPPAAGLHGLASQIHIHRKSPPLRRRSRNHQGPRQFRHRNRHRRRQRRHSESGLRSQRGHSVG